MELIKSAGRRTRVSEVVYIVLNLLLPVALLGLIRFVDTPYIAFALVILSKWRIFAVRPRYWLMNLKSNLIDIAVGVSFVILLMLANGSLVTQIILAAMYGVWLIYLKPKSQRHFMVMQAGIAQFVALMALFSYSQYLDVVTIVTMSWIIGYAAARHAISGYEEEHLETIALVWALLLAELAWFAFHWTLAYPLLGGITAPQVAALSAVIGFGAYNLYDNFHHKNPNPLKARLTVGVCVFLIAVVLVFSRWNVAI
jgi:hypothetical protein